MQASIQSHPAKYKVIACGRQVGKTLLCAADAAELVQRGKRLLYVSPSQKQTDAFWEYVTQFTAHLDCYKNESRRIIRYAGGLLEVQTASQPDALRSGHFDKIYFDECAYLDGRVWSQVGLPMLLQSDGNAWFMSTPKRRNWFFEHFIKAQQSQTDDPDGRWAVWNFPTTANPHLSPDALAILTGEMTEADYQQEILAQFLEGQGAVFRNIDATCILAPREPYAGEFIMGVDWAQKQDYTVLAVMDRKTREMVALDRFNRIDWSLQRGRLRAMYDRWKPRVIWAEENSIGSPNIEALQQEGLPVRAFQTTGTTKPPLIESLVLAFERGECKLLNDPVLKGEFMAYERKITSTGRSQYSAPDGMHDDCVMATALSWYGCMMPYGASLISFA